MRDGLHLDPWKPVGTGSSPLGPPNGSWTVDGSELDVFAVGSDHYVYEITCTLDANGQCQWSASGWRRLQWYDKPRAVEEATVARDPFGRLDLFVLGADGAAWETYTYDNGQTWGPAVSLSGSPLGGPSGSWRNDGTELDVIAVGGDHNLYEKQYTNQGGLWSWSPSWQPIHGQSSGLAATEMLGLARQPNSYRLDIFLRSTDGAAWHEYIDISGNMSTPESLYGSPLGAPTGAWTGNGNELDAFALGQDSRPYWKSWPSSSWNTTSWTGPL